MTLTKDQVDFEITVEPEDEAPEGFFAYETEEENREAAQWIRDQLEAGNELAWCVVLVTARPKDERLAKHFKGFDSLGAVSCADRKDFDQLVEDHAMFENALTHLNEQIAEVGAALCG